MKTSKGNKLATALTLIKRILIIVVACALTIALVLFGVTKIVAKVGEGNLKKAEQNAADITDSDNISVVDGEIVANENSSTTNVEVDDNLLSIIEELGGSLSNEETVVTPTVEPTESPSPSPTTTAKTTWKSGWVKYRGEIYEYNDNLMTFLALGIDKNGAVSYSTSLTGGGQSDAIFLIVADKSTKQIKIIAVNRDTIVDITMVGIGSNGSDIVFPYEICVQHGFGGGTEYSCELTKNAVSKLFYNIPIHGYGSFNMGGLGALNDAVGGVDLTLKANLTNLYSDWYAGNTVHISGKQAEEYLRERDCNVYESAKDRLANQMLYITAFANKIIDSTKQDISTPVRLYNIFKDYIVTDLSLDKITYLASELPGYTLDTTVYSMEGSTQIYYNHEGFYPDQSKLLDMVMKIFYRKVVIEE